MTATSGRSPTARNLSDDIPLSLRRVRRIRVRGSLFQLLPRELLDHIISTLREDGALRSLANLNFTGQYMYEVTFKSLWKNVTWNRWNRQTWDGMIRFRDVGDAGLPSKETGRADALQLRFIISDNLPKSPPPISKGFNPRGRPPHLYSIEKLDYAAGPSYSATSLPIPPVEVLFADDPLPGLSKWTSEVLPLKSAFLPHVTTVMRPLGSERVEYILQYYIPTSHDVGTMLRKLEPKIVELFVTVEKIDDYTPEPKSARSTYTTHFTATATLQGGRPALEQKARDIERHIKKLEREIADAFAHGQEGNCIKLKITLGSRRR